MHKTSIPRDYIGDQIANILSYRNIVLEWSKKPATKAKPNKHLTANAIMRNCITNKCKQGISVLNKMAVIYKSRKPVTFDNRSIQYYKSIFPPVIPCPPRSNPKFIYDPITRAIDTAQQLLKLKRFLKPPDKWPELNIFKKEMLYAQYLEKDPRFIVDIKQLSKTYEAILSTVKGDIHIGMDYAEQVDAEHDDIEDLPIEEDRFKYKLSALCYRYCLAGLTMDLKPIPLPFQIQIDGCIARIVIPNYMEIDWKRDIPNNVIRYIQKRGTIESRIRPIRLSVQDRPTGDGPIDDVILARYYELLQQMKSSPRSKNMNWVYDTLCKDKKYSISIAKNLEDKRRACRRRIRNIMKRKAIA